MQKKKLPGYLSKEAALKKLQNFCAYQERCQTEVRTKLIELGIYGDSLEEIIAELIGEDFINEERFAATFAGGKFRIKQWGRIKIVQALKLKKISDYCIRKALEKEINDEDYTDTLNKLLLKKITSISETDKIKKRYLLLQYAVGRGYEVEIIKKVLNEINV
jgi:regulatory protein